MEIINLPSTATFIDIITEVDKDKTIGKMFYFLIGNRKVQAERKYRWKGKMAVSSYLHIYKVIDFNGPVIEHWREQKDGSFETI